MCSISSCSLPAVEIVDSFDASVQPSAEDVLDDACDVAEKSAAAEKECIVRRERIAKEMESHYDALNEAEAVMKASVAAYNEAEIKMKASIAIFNRKEASRIETMAEM